MSSVVFYFQVHQPFRLRHFEMFDVGSGNYFATEGEKIGNRQVLNKVADKCYLPANTIILKLLRKHPEFKVSFSISGIALEQFELFRPDVLESFQALVKTGRVELLAETYYHSLAYLHSKDEFKRQVNKHQEAIQGLFGVKATAFRNTELIYDNDLAKLAEKMGFEVILAEGVDRHLGWRSPNFVYRPKGCKHIRLLLKNYRLSDDVAFRFSKRDWSEWPVNAAKYADWIDKTEGDVVNLFMDYETFGEHQWAETGIFKFLEELPEELIKRGLSISTVTEAIKTHEVKGSLDMPNVTSWADMERDDSAWRGNPMQETAAKAVFELETAVRESADDSLIEDWSKLTTSDHFYYMSTKGKTDGEVHRYFSPYQTPFEIYGTYMNVLHDMRMRCYSNK